MVEVSHREPAFELGTVREVSSRHLRDFERQGLVSLSRKSIELVDIHGLESMLAG